MFDLYSKGFGEKNSFGGGGRYDYLSKSGIIPATGFAIDSEKNIEELRLWSKENNFSEIISVSQNKIDRIEV